MQARYYDPVIGRFYSNDPVDVLGHASIGKMVHGFNRYVYANNNPYRFIDPTGKIGMETVRFDRISGGQAMQVQQQIGEAILEVSGISDAISSVKSALSGDLSGAAVAVVGAACKPCKAATMQRKLEKGQIAKKSHIDRFDSADPNQPGSKDHVHFKDGTSMNNDGTPHDKHKGTPTPNKAARKALKDNDWADKPEDK